MNINQSIGSNNGYSLTPFSFEEKENLSFESEKNNKIKSMDDLIESFSFIRPGLQKEKLINLEVINFLSTSEKKLIFFFSFLERSLKNKDFCSKKWESFVLLFIEVYKVDFSWKDYFREVFFIFMDKKKENEPLIIWKIMYYSSKFSYVIDNYDSYKKIKEEEEPDEVKEYIKDRLYKILENLPSSFVLDGLIRSYLSEEDHFLLNLRLKKSKILEIFFKNIVYKILFVDESCQDSIQYIRKYIEKRDQLFLGKIDFLLGALVMKLYNNNKECSFQDLYSLLVLINLSQIKDIPSFINNYKVLIELSIQKVFRIQSSEFSFCQWRVLDGPIEEKICKDIVGVCEQVKILELNWKERFIIDRKSYSQLTCLDRWINDLSVKNFLIFRGMQAIYSEIGRIGFRCNKVKANKSWVFRNLLLILKKANVFMYHQLEGDRLKKSVKKLFLVDLHAPFLGHNVGYSAKNLMRERYSRVYNNF